MGKYLDPNGTYYEGDWQPGSMEVAEKPLGLRQADVWTAIQARRSTSCANGVLVTTTPASGTAMAVEKWFHTDTASLFQHLGNNDTAGKQLSAGGQPSDALLVNGSAVSWKTMDGSFVALTVQNALDIVAAIKNQQAAAFANAEKHKSAMQQVADPENYDFSAGWPATYRGA